MLEALASIDTSVIEELCKIKDEQEVLRGRLDKMSEMKGKVTDAVFDRVRRDYEGRHAALEDSARPLKKQGRAEYAKLAVLNKQLAANLETARLAREELEFRNELGEFAEAEFRRQIQESAERVQQGEADVAESLALKERFIAAFHSEDDLKLPVEPTPPAPAKPEVKAAPEPVRRAEAKEDRPAPRGAEVAKPPVPAMPPAFVPAAPAAKPAAPAALAEAKPGQPVPAATREVRAAIPTPAAPQRVPDADSGDATAILSRPRLVSQGADGRLEEFPLSFVATSIGRSPENDICVAAESVSRKHAKIVMNEKGFTIVDLKSENGVFVNGERVAAQRLLATGDVIEIGPGAKKFTFYGP